MFLFLLQRTAPAAGSIIFTSCLKAVRPIVVAKWVPIAVPIQSLANKQTLPRYREASLAQWIRMWLLSLSPRVESQAHHLHFSSQNFVLYLSLYREMEENKQKEAGFGPFVTNKGSPLVYQCPSKFFLNWPTSRLFYFWSFQKTSLQFFQQIYVKIVHPVYGTGKRTQNLWNMSLLP